MPPRGAKKRPDPTLVDRPIPLDTTEPQVLHSLLPYLALGFTSTETSSAGFLCGIGALCHSYNAANRALTGPNSAKIPELDPEDWIQWFEESQDYDDSVEAYVNSHEVYFPTKEDKEEAIGWMKQKNWLDSTQLSCLLDVANKIYNTKYRLGLITRGFWVKWVEKDNDFDYNHLLQTAPTVPGGIDNRPILWIFNDNLESRSLSHKEITRKAKGFGKSKGNHWEGFKIIEQDDGDYEWRQQEVQQFAVGGRIAADIKAGVWVLTSDGYTNDRDTKADPRSHLGDEDEGVEEDEVEEENQLMSPFAGLITAYKGSFLRLQQKPAEVFVPEDYWYMATSNATRGLVHRDDIELIEAHEDIPTASTDFFWADVTAKTKPSPGKGTKIGGHTSGGGGCESADADNDNTSQLRILRIILATDKSGRPAKVVDPINYFIDNFACDFGEFVLDSTQRVEKPGTNAARVTRSDGVQGEIWLRNLQLIENPFGLKGRLPVRAPSGLTMKNTVKEMGQVAVAYGIPTKGLVKKDVLKSITDIEDNNTTYLALWRLNRNFNASELDSQVDFVEGEYVLERTVVKANKKKKKCYVVRDFEGYEAQIEEKHLELMSDRAWDLRMLGSRGDASGFFLPLCGKQASPPTPIIPPKKKSPINLPPQSPSLPILSPKKGSLPISPQKSAGKGGANPKGPGKFTPGKKNGKHPAPTDDSDDELAEGNGKKPKK